MEMNGYSWIFLDRRRFASVAYINRAKITPILAFPHRRDLRPHLSSQQTDPCNLPACTKPLPSQPQNFLDFDLQRIDDEIKAHGNSPIAQAIFLSQWTREHSSRSSCVPRTPTAHSSLPHQHDLPRAPPRSPQAHSPSPRTPKHGTSPSPASSNPPSGPP